MNDRCHNCRIRKSCYFDEPEEDWTCDSYKPCEYDEEDDVDVEMINLDGAISETAYILQCIAVLKSIQESGCCNDCGVKNCQYKPALGKPVRYNCPFYERRDK